MGVNEFVAEGEVEPRRILKVNPEVARRQRARLRALRARRDEGEVEASLSQLGEAAKGEGNLMEPILRCVRSYATLGEICDRLRGVFGEYKERSTL